MRRRKRKNGSRRWKVGRRHRGFLPGRGGKGGCAREQGGVKDIQREPTVVVSDAGCCQHTSCQHTPGARHTYTHMHTGLALSVQTTLPTVPPPPTPHHHQFTPTPHNPWGPNLESVYSDNPGAKLALLRACSCIFHWVRDVGWLRSRHKNWSHVTMLRG